MMNFTTEKIDKIICCSCQNNKYDDKLCDKCMNIIFLEQDKEILVQDDEDFSNNENCAMLDDCSNNERCNIQDGLPNNKLCTEQDNFSNNESCIIQDSFPNNEICITQEDYSNIKCKCGNLSIINRLDCIICFNKKNPKEHFSRKCKSCRKQPAAHDDKWCQQCLDSNNFAFTYIFHPSIFDSYCSETPKNLREEYISVIIFLKRRLLDKYIFPSISLKIDYEHRELIENFAVDEKNIFDSKYDIIRMHMLLCCEKYIFVMSEYLKWINRNRYYIDNPHSAKEKYRDVNNLMYLLNIPLKYNKMIAKCIILILYKTKILPKFLVMNIVFMVTGLYNIQYNEIFESINPTYYKYAIKNQNKYDLFKKNLVFYNWYKELELNIFWN